MELPTVGSADLLRQSTNNNIENVTLLSYNPNKIKQNHQQQNQNYIQRKFVPNQATNNYVVSSCAQTSGISGKKFNFRQFRKRSKSASRLDERRRSASTSNLAEVKVEQPLVQESITSDLKPVASKEANQVELVGFSTCNSEFANRANLIESSPNQRFQTLKTSREVKMERERLRQEKLHRLTQVSKEMRSSCESSFFVEKIMFSSPLDSKTSLTQNIEKCSSMQKFLSHF